MSSITGSRHNCEQGQPKPQLGGGAQPTTTTKPQGGRGRAPPQAPPHRGRGGYHGVGGGGGVWQPCIIYRLKGWDIYRLKCWDIGLRAGYLGQISAV